MPGIDGQRSEHREDPLVEPVVEFGALFVGDVGPRDDADTHSTQLGNELIDEDSVDTIDEFEDALADLGQCVGGGSSVRRRPVDPGDDLVLERSDSHLEELVEVR